MVGSLDPLDETDVQLKRRMMKDAWGPRSHFAFDLTSSSCVNGIAGHDGL